jgi:hypothetical protein
VCALTETGPACTKQIVLGCDPYTCPGEKEPWARTAELPGDGTIVVATDSKAPAALDGIGARKLPF